MCEKEISGKSQISDNEVENDRAKFVNGLGMISEINHGGALDSPSFCQVISQITYHQWR